MAYSMRFCALLFLCAFASACANDWSHWRGPQRDGSTKEDRWSHQWGKDGPRKQWDLQIGAGYSNLCIFGKTGYTLGSGGMKGSESSYELYAIDLETGKLKWTTRLPAGSESKKYGNTSFSTPVTDGTLVYAVGGHGEFAAVRADTGAIVWNKDIFAEGAMRPMRDIVAASPLLLKDLVILNTALAVDRQTGAVAWKTEQGISDRYASPVPVVLDGHDCVLISGKKDAKSAALYCLSATTGKMLWDISFSKYPFNYPGGVGDPLVISPDHVLYSCSSGYALLRISEKGAEVEKEFIWGKSSVCDSVICDKLMFGFTSYVGDPPTPKNIEASALQCMDLTTGEIKWKQNNMIGTVLLAGNRLIVVTISGHLAVLDAAASNYKELASAQLETSDIKGGRDGYWTAPILCNGRLYIRRLCGGKSVVTCFDLSDGKP